jgi:hypothetical protein
MAFFPAGSRSTWRVPHEVRKLAFCQNSLPWVVGFAVRAWSKIMRKLAGSVPAAPGRTVTGALSG